MRLYAAPLPDDGGPAAGGAVLVASSTTDIEQTLHRLGLLLLLSGLLAAGVGGAAAAVLTRRGLGPLARVSSAAAEIERTGDASRRLPDPHADGEVAELTRTLNQMLAALDAARLRERRFLADASHELRTPVTSLAGNVEFVARHGVNPEVLADLQLDTAAPAAAGRRPAGPRARERRPGARAATCASTRSWPTRWPAATAVRVERLRRR